MKDARLNGVSVELGDFIKRSANQGRVQYVPEYDALIIESEEELFLVSLSAGIKDWLRNKGEHAGYCHRTPWGSIPTRQTMY